MDRSVKAHSFARPNRLFATDPKIILCTAGWLALVVTLPGCSGIRFGRIGFGNPVFRVYREVAVRGHWCPDSRHVIVQRTTRKKTARCPMLLFPILVPCGVDYGEHWGKEEIFLLDVTRPSAIKKLADGDQPYVCPQGTFVAYRHWPTEGAKIVRGTSVPACHLWLLNYATGEKRLLDEHVASCEFSKDGKWITWTSRVDIATGCRRAFATEVAEPSKTRTYATELGQFAEKGWRLGRVWMADDGSQCYDWIRGDNDSAAPWECLRLRYAPPEWKMEEVPLPPRPKGQVLTRLEFRPTDWSPGPSPDGKLILKRKQVEFKAPDLLVFPESEKMVENLCLELPDGTTRQLTHFKAP